MQGSSAGGGFSTAEDMLKFVWALRSGKLLGALSQEWFRGEQAYAELDIDPVPGWTLVVLVNDDPPAANTVAQKIKIWLKRLK